MKGFDFWQFIAGVAIFVFAMSLIEESLKNISGRSFKIFLQKQSKSRIKMMAASTVVTATLQSSSIVLLMVLSFVGAGLMNLRGALAAALGSNLGTTLDSWVIAIIGFKINFDSLSFPILGIALVGLLLFKKKTKLYYATTFLIGFAFIFISLELLKNCVDKSLENYLGNFSGLHYLLYIPIGFIITAIIQSSLVTIAITLSALYNHLIPFESAAAVVIGSELGTTLKFIIGSVGGIADKKRVAWGNFIINLITMVLAAIILQPFIYLIQSILGIKDPLTGLVAFQTGINLAAILIFYPFLGKFAVFLEKLFVKKEHAELTLYIGKTTNALPADYLKTSELEILHLMNETIELNKNVFRIHNNKNGSWIANIKNLASDSGSFSHTYEKLKMLQGEILEFITEMPKAEMSEIEIEQTGKTVNIVRHVMRSAKNLKDIRHNLKEFDGSVNDYLYNLFIGMKESEKDFYNDFQQLLKDPVKASHEKITELTSQNRYQYDDAINKILGSLKENKINELNSSNLLNVYREIYSSNKALILALADLKNLDEEGNIPGV